MIRILVIEDDRAIRLSLEEDLATEGYDVELASDGASGLAIAMRGEHHLILLDLMLPGMSGLDVCRELRRKGIRTAIIMLFGAVVPKIASRCDRYCANVPW